MKFGLNNFLSKIQNKDIGNPTNITYKGSLLNIDYLLSAEEILFLFKELREVKSILEIGPGFGRLFYSILQYFENIDNYYIVDLKFMLSFQKKYLSKVLTKKSMKRLFSCHLKRSQKISDIDLTINIDSFQEIKPEVVKDYMDFISLNSKYFYSKMLFVNITLHQ